MSDDLKNILNAKPCSEGMEERVLALADGWDAPDKEMEEIFTHFLKCDSCRYLFEDFYLSEEAKAEADAEKSDSPLQSLDEIIVKFTNGMITPVGEAFLSRAATAAVLSGELSMVVDYVLPSNSGDLSVRLVGTGDDIRIEADSDSDSSVFYLFHGKEYVRANTYEGVAVFENVKPGSYIITRDLKDFIKIKVVVD